MGNNNNNYCPSHIDVMEGEDKNRITIQGEVEAGRHAVEGMIDKNPTEEHDGAISRESGDEHIEPRSEKSPEISVSQRIYWIYHKNLPPRDMPEADTPAFGKWLLNQSVELVSTLKDLGIEIDGAEVTNENNLHKPNLTAVEKMEKIAELLGSLNLADKVGEFFRPEDELRDKNIAHKQTIAELQRKLIDLKLKSLEGAKSRGEFPPSFELSLENIDLMDKEEELRQEVIERTLELVREDAKLHRDNTDKSRFVDKSVYEAPAQELLHDFSAITKNVVGKVLKDHGIDTIGEFRSKGRKYIEEKVAPDLHFYGVDTSDIIKGFDDLGIAFED